MSSNGSQHHNHVSQRIRQIFRPDGRKVHIATSPEDIERLKRVLSGTGDVAYELVLHGSPEHIDALKETHAHHERMRESYRQLHGDSFDEFERVIRQVDMLATELHMGAVQLDATFSKYGYSAHLRKLTAARSIIP